MKDSRLKMLQPQFSIECYRNRIQRTLPWMRNRMIAITNGENGVNGQIQSEIHEKNDVRKSNVLLGNALPKKESFTLKSRNRR